MAAALPCCRHKEYRPKHKWRGEIHGISKEPHHQWAQDLTAIGHRAQPTDCDALQRAWNLIAYDRRRDSRHETRFAPSTCLLLRVRRHDRPYSDWKTRRWCSDYRGQRIAGRDEPTQPAESDELTERVRRVLDEEVNPAIAAHRGRATLVDVTAGRVRIRLEGGCQGCSLAEVTVRQGIESILRKHVPEVVAIVDVTDHEAGTEPFFAPGKR